MKSNNTITQLNLSSKERKKEQNQIMKEKQNGVKDKSGNELGAKGLIKISEMLKTNSTLIDFNLSGILIWKSTKINKNDS